MTMQKLRRPDVYRGMLIGIGLTFLNQYCGSFVLSVYSVGIFQESGTRIDPYVSTIILGILQVAGTLSSTSLVDTFGRKPLLTISLAGCALGLSAMTSFIYLHHLGYDLTIVDWIPVVSSGFVIFISFVGIQSLTMLCIVESLPAEVRKRKISIRPSSFYNRFFHFFLFKIGTKLWTGHFDNDKQCVLILFVEILPNFGRNNSIAWSHINVCHYQRNWNGFCSCYD